MGYAKKSKYREKQSLAGALIDTYRHIEPIYSHPAD